MKVARYRLKVPFPREQRDSSTAGNRKQKKRTLQALEQQENFHCALKKVRQSPIHRRQPTLG